MSSVNEQINLPVLLSAYSSLLRITTAPPANPLDPKDQPNTPTNPNGNPNSATDGLPALGSLSISPNVTNGNGNPESPRAGFFAKPNFFRSLTGRGGSPSSPIATSTPTGTGTGTSDSQQMAVEMTESLPTRPLDVESAGGIGRTGT